jgi:hypothetical protein
MFPDVSGDELAAGDDLESLAAYEIERALRKCRTDAATAHLRGYFGVIEADFAFPSRVGYEGNMAIDRELISLRGCVVANWSEHDLLLI